MSIFNVHAGHCPQGQGAYGACGILQESVENRKVKNKVIELLRANGHTVYDCTFDQWGTQNSCLVGIVNKCNQHKVDLDISIHLNAGGGTGCEVENYDSRTKAVSDRICANISNALGIKNRGTKYMPELYVLKNTKSLALLVECCFVDSQTDAERWNADKCAKAIVEGVLGTAIQNTNTGSSSGGMTPSKEQASGKIDVEHQALASGKGWLATVLNFNNTNSNGYSGWFGFPLLAFRAKTKGDAALAGYLEYRAHGKGKGWFDWRRDYNKDSAGDTFAGDGKTPIDGIQMRIVGISGKHVRYRVHCIGKGWLDWVTDYGDGDNGYAGWYGYAIDAVQIEII